MKIFLFHGTYTGITENWYQSFARTFKNLGHEVVLPQYPIDSYQEITELGEETARAKVDRVQIGLIILRKKFYHNVQVV
ncbi:hypothetical protein IT418_01675 [bacterium]|nr:hypothetical protein [bacterium]